MHLPGVEITKYISQLLLPARKQRYPHRRSLSEAGGVFNGATDAVFDTASDVAGKVVLLVPPAVRPVSSVMQRMIHSL